MNLLIPNPRDIPAFVKTLAQLPGEHVPGGEHAVQRPGERPGVCAARLLGPGGLQRRRHGRASGDRRQWLQVTGCPIVEGYGLVGDLAGRDVNRVDSQAFTGTIGLPMPSTEIAIRDDDGADVAAGQPGEICIRGPQVMAGYWQRPDETALVMTADGFFKSGDIGVMDDARLRPDRRPQEGHDSGVRLQCLSDRDRTGGQPAPGRARVRRDRRTRRALRRSGQAVRRQERSRRCRKTTWPTTAATTSPRTSGRRQSSFATSCRRAMSARYCAGNCVRAHEIRISHAQPRKGEKPGHNVTGLFLFNSLTMSYFHTGIRTIIGAEAFHCPVRDGKEWDHLAMVIRLNLSPPRLTRQDSQFIESNQFDCVPTWHNPY